MSPVCGELYCLNDIFSPSVDELMRVIEDRDGIPIFEQRLICNGKQVYAGDSLCTSELVYVDVKLRVCGGKGGFGSLLRGGQPGAHKKKNTNFGACRDLNGRRIRHVKQEEEIAQWQQEQLEKEKTQNNKPTKTDKLPTVELEDFIEETTLVSDMVASAVQEALENSNLPLLAQKRPLPDDVPSPDRKKAKVDSTEETKKEDLEEPVWKGKLKLDDYDLEGLKELGMDVLKDALTDRGLKCGGSLEQRATRLISIKGKPKSEWDRKLFAKKGR